jgi:hypothetical protein
MVLQGHLSFHPLVVDGKDQVLGLHRLIHSSTVHDKSKQRYFVDNDFDGLRGAPLSSDIYCTPTYSIENLLVSSVILSALLKGEFRCSDETGIDEVRKVVDRFESLLSDFIEHFRKANLRIYFARKNARKIVNIEERLGRYVKCKIDAIVSVHDDNLLSTLIPIEPTPDEVSLQGVELEFSKLSPQHSWRGKFFFAFFRQFLTLLKEDRCSQAPTLFSQRVSISFNPSGDIVRVLTGMIEIPPCMRKFVEDMCPAPAIKEQ